MNNHKYVGLDTDQATIIARVEDDKGNFIMEGAIETSASSIRQFFKGLDGTIHVAFEEGTQAAWLYDVIRPLVSTVTVCDGRRNKLIQSGNKADRIDAAKLTRLLRLGELHAVYHGERSTRGLKELVHGYESLVTDTTRAKNRLKAVFRSQAVRCRGQERPAHPDDHPGFGQLGVELYLVEFGFLKLSVCGHVKVRASG